MDTPCFIQKCLKLVIWLTSVPNVMSMDSSTSTFMSSSSSSSAMTVEIHCQTTKPYRPAWKIWLFSKMDNHKLSFPQNYQKSSTAFESYIYISTIFYYIVEVLWFMTHQILSRVNPTQKTPFLNATFDFYKKTFPSLWLLGHKSVLGLQICYPHRLRKTKAKMIAKATKNTTWAPQFR